MTPANYITRLALPGAMAVFALMSLAYWWLDNLPHEIFGTVMFALLVWHIVVNRLWFKNLFRGRYDARRTVAVGLHLMLIVNMTVLVLTSIIISKSVFPFLPIPDNIYMRDVHWFSAYWVMIIVGIHVGLHWTRVMGTTRTSLRLSPSGRIRTLWLRIAALLVAAFGVWSFLVLGVWAKLTFTYSLDFWDFTASVTPFFGHWLGVISLPAVLTHYGMTWWRRSSRMVSASRPSRAASGDASQGAAQS